MASLPAKFPGNYSLFIFLLFLSFPQCKSVPESTISQGIGRLRPDEAHRAGGAILSTG